MMKNPNHENHLILRSCAYLLSRSHYNMRQVEVQIGILRSWNLRGKRQVKPFERVWGLDDEIKLLKGMIQLKEKILAQPNDYEAILSYTRNSLCFQPTLLQLKEKIRGLREDYKDNTRTPHTNINFDHEAI
ncbi:hypothetical protein ACH5RR_012959 [Cinchona calisaya]|uniref:Glabrous enhancer-binding protein-like DBD domain-containing protein n=1 Tax=Cinchona calisaya TaxID=153742 RepID=A0ABD3A1C4_9GENT